MQLILLVEDDHKIAANVTLRLREEGYGVVAFRDAEADGFDGLGHGGLAGDDDGRRHDVAGHAQQVDAAHPRQPDVEQGHVGRHAVRVAQIRQRLLGGAEGHHAVALLAQA